MVSGKQSLEVMRLHLPPVTRSKKHPEGKCEARSAVQGEGWQALSSITWEALLRTERGSAGRLLAGRDSSPSASCTVVAEHPAETSAQPPGEWRGHAPVSLHPSLAVPPTASARLNWGRAGAGEGSAPSLAEVYVGVQLCAASSFLSGAAGRFRVLRWGVLVGLLRRKNGKKREKGKNLFQLSVFYGSMILFL